MGFPLVCCESVLLPFLNNNNKKATSAYGRVEKSDVKSKQTYKGRVGRIREMPCSCQGEKQDRTSKPQPHGLN